MELFLSGPSFRYECENLCRLFFPLQPCQSGAMGRTRPA